jgi:hypothetical protein
MRKHYLCALLVASAPLQALAERVDITDPAVLGDVLVSVDLNPEGVFDYERVISEVRYTGGVYSYVYAVQTSPYFPSGFGLYEGEGGLVDFTVMGADLSGTWGAIYGPNTNPVLDIAPIQHGFVVVPESRGSIMFTMMYMQSTHGPSSTGTLLYNGRSYCLTEPFCFDDAGSLHYEYGGLVFNGAYVPTPEPATLALLGLGVTGLAAKYRRRLSG